MSYDKVTALLSKGVSRPALYQVMVPGITRQANDQLEFMCRETRVPEVTSVSITANGHEAMGVVREQPVRVSFASPFSISVISDRDYVVYKAMREWFDSTAQNANPFFLGSGDSQRINYYREFVRDITLRKLELNGSTNREQDSEGYYSPFEIVFNNAYPIRIGEISLSSEARDAYVEFNIDFAYETYTFVPTDSTVGVTR